MPQPIERLLFVYNADSGLLSLLADGARKLLGIGDCALCDLTHGMTGERSEFARCRAELGVAIELLHRDELDGALGELLDGALPAVVAVVGGEPRVLLTPELIACCDGSIDALQRALGQHAARQGLSL